MKALIIAAIVLLPVVASADPPSCESVAKMGYDACRSKARASAGNDTQSLMGALTACDGPYFSNLAACKRPQRHEVAVSAQTDDGLGPDGPEDCYAEASRAPKINALPVRLACEKRVAAATVELRAANDATKLLLSPATYEDMSDAALDSVVRDAITSYGKVNQLLPRAGKPSIVNFEAESTRMSVEVQKAVDAEKACRADKKCMQVRAAKKAEAEFVEHVVSFMCGSDQAREQAIAARQHEHANPSGYVDKDLLYKLGADQQAAEDTIKALMPAYVRTRKHPWRGWRSECPVTP